MPVMRHLNVGGTTYDTVGEASVTQVLGSGTKIATVSIDGTSTDLYAPEGGSSVDPATATPSMDGTAAVGSSTKYAREDHVHPHDTSRQETLVSGTNIKTVNNESLLGSGNITTPTYTLPTASTSTLGGVKVDGTTITAAADGTISAASSGGVDYYTTTATLTVAGWSNNAQTANVSGMTASADVIVAPAPASMSAWASAGVYCTAQGAGTLTFACSTVPTGVLIANVMVLEGGATVVGDPIVTITLTNQSHTTSTNGVAVTNHDTADKYDGSAVNLDFIKSATGSMTYSMSKPYFSVVANGLSPSWIYEEMCTCSGGVSFVSSSDGSATFLASSDGTLTIDGIDYDE